MDEPPGYSNLMAILSGTALSDSVGLMAIGLLLFLSAFVSACRAAFSSLSPDDLNDYRQNHNSRQKIVVVLTNDIRRLNATMWVLEVVIHFGIIMLSAILSPFIRHWDVGVLFTALVLIFLTHLLPRSYGVRKNSSVAQATAGIWKISVALLKPVTSLLLKKNGTHENRVDTVHFNASAEELAEALGLELETGNEKETLRSVLDFRAYTVKRLMRPRQEIVSVSLALNFHELNEHLKRINFSRIPVYRDTLDSVEGILHSKDLLPFLEADANFPWQKLLRPAYFIAETKRIEFLLNELQVQGFQMALAKDGKGNIAGVITKEDIIEETIQDLNSGFHAIAQGYRLIDDHTFVFDGRIILTDFYKALNPEQGILPVLDLDHKTLNNLLQNLKDELPAVGDVIPYEHFTFTIESVERQEIRRVRVHIHEQTNG